MSAAFGDRIHEAWPELRLRDDDSLWTEPRWNAGRRAAPSFFPPPRAVENEGGGSAAARKVAEVTEQRLTAFRFLFISSCRVG